MKARESSPRPWGCFPLPRCVSSMRWVFPTPVGVFPAQAHFANPQARLPHARGGVSRPFKVCALKVWSSPRPWGCFSSFACSVGIGLVFPTPVGGFPSIHAEAGLHRSLPHARGGVSQSPPRALRKRRSSPRPWGCFLSMTILFHTKKVFPTPVGVFLGQRRG